MTSSRTISPNIQRARAAYNALPADMEVIKMHPKQKRGRKVTDTNGSVSGSESERNSREYVKPWHELKMEQITPKYGELVRRAPCLPPAVITALQKQRTV
eukprot:GHVO01067654.1.p1 GENE.GHVO01067654.1~~GHVO01067654.1.p1  ORF type:complete len:100 (+),score=8.59 GHVO01067654.1:500-799(+)